jgi:DNA polymerase III subunit delta'
MLNIYPWQQANWDNIVKQWQQNTMPHALLLEGPKGLGKFEFAKTLAARVLCAASLVAPRDVHNLPCGTCRSCHLFNTFHPDFILLEPEEKSNSIKIDAVRSVIEKIQQTSTFGGYQVVIINPAEAMNINCANALLKTLEEPPENVLFLLVSHQAAKLPATVQSRCQRLNFSTPSDEVSMNWLKEQASVQNLEALLRISEYAPLRALDLAKRNFLSLRDDLIKDLESILQLEESPIAPVTNWLKQDMDLFFLAYLNILLDVFRILLNVDPQFLINQDRKTELLDLSRRMNIAKVEAKLTEVQAARALILGHANPNLQLLIERVFSC